MAEVPPTPPAPTNVNPDDKGSGTGTNTPPTPPAPDASGFDIDKLDKSAWEKIFQHDRFKQLNEKAKAADQLLKEKKDADDAALKEQGKWQDLAGKREQEVERWKASSIASEIKALAAKEGAVDLDAVALLADKSGVKINDDGTITGAEEVVKAMRESKPYLFNNSNTRTQVGNGTNPGNANNQSVPKFTHSQIKDPVFWKAHEAEIMTALRTGQVVDDISR